jgi:SUN domain-containing protein 1/2
LSGDVAPPEALIQKNTLPGSCWPMEGSTGQVTLKLAYPVVVESVSIDHISQDIIPESKYDSAPKHMKIVGYPPCGDDDSSSNCVAIGFDLNNPIDIAEIQYDVDGPSIQTFDSYYTKAIDSMPPPLPAPTTAFSINDDDDDDDDDDNEEEEVASGSCSVQAASCSGPPRISVAAVAVKVLENWGNPDFTCLYRLRLHGDPDSI